MNYTLDRGLQRESMDNVQRGVLWGLPAIAMLLSIGVIRHHNASLYPVSTTAKEIPIVSSLGAPSGNNSSGSSGSTDSGSTDTNLSAAPSSDMSAGATASGGGSSSYPLVGGRGGGPTASSSSSSGGLLPLNNTVTVPPASVQVGSKPIVDSSGTIIFVN